MTTTVSICERKLSDGSEVYDVSFAGVVFPAITHEDAVAFADKVSAAIDAHTNEVVTRDF